MIEFLFAASGAVVIGYLFFSGLHLPDLWVGQSEGREKRTGGKAA